MKDCSVDSVERLWYLRKGNEEQLFMSVFEARQGPLWTMFPHPLLICLCRETERCAGSE